MQQSGTLRKRKRRAIAKVNGLGIIPYREDHDDFDGANLFGTSQKQECSATEQSEKQFSVSNGEHTSLWLTAKDLLQYRRKAAEYASGSSRGTRVTRDPAYHLEYSQDEEKNVGVIAAEEQLKNNEIESLTLDSERKSLASTLKDRSQFLDKCTMQRLRLIIWLGATTGAFPWKWNSKTKQVDRWTPTLEKLWWIQWFFLSIQTSCLALFQMYSFHHSYTTTSKTYRQVFQSSLSVLWYIWNVFYNVNMYVYKDDIREYINTMLRFNQKYVQKYVIHLDGHSDGGWYVIRVAILSSMLQVFITVTLFLLLPFAPWYLFSFLYPKPWYWLVPGAIQEYCMTGQVITSYTLIGWLLVCHTNTVQFWLRETHNGNESDFTIDSLRTPKTSMETYKSLHILCQSFNDCMSPLAIPLIKFQMCAAIVVCGYVLIRSTNHLFIDEFPAVMSYPIGVLDTASMAFLLLNMAAGVFDLGCSFIDSWSRTKHKDFRRILMSCPTLKVCVGKFYPVTISTTLTFFQETFGKITDAIITFP